VVAALERSAAAFDRWAAEADPALRKEQQTLHAGLLAAAQICRAMQQQNV
jgi:ABC-type siderophore export system fused ATPase/permease subunit